MSYLSKYGVARKIRVPIVKRGVVDHAVGADWTPAAGDVKISKDGGAAANVTNLPTAIAMGNSTVWEFSLTATEMQAAEVNVTISDSATKTVEDNAFDIETYGNASAQHAVDLSDSVRAGLTALPNAAAEAAGGLYTRGVGAGQIKQTNNGEIDANATRVAGTAQTAGDIPARLPAALVSGRMDASVGAMAANVITDAAYDTTVGKMSALGIIDQGTAQAATSTTLQLRAADAYADNELVGAIIMIVSATTGAGQCRQITGYVGSTDTATVDAWSTTPTGTIVYKVFAGPPGTAASLTAIAAAVWDLLTSGHTTAGTFGAAMVAAGSAGDPWSTALPGAYGAGTAGAKVGNFLTGDSYVRLGAPAGASHAADTAAVKTDTGNIAAKTNSLTFTVANVLDANALRVGGTVQTGRDLGASVLLSSGTGAGQLSITSGIVGASLSAAERNSAADAMLDRDMSVGADNGSPTVRTPRQALRAVRNKSSVSGSTLTVTKEDDTTASWTAVVTTDAAAVPITGIDPA